MIHRPLETELPTEGVSHDAAIRKQVVFRHGEIPGITQLALSTLEPGQSTSPHAHEDMSEIYLVVSGRGTFEIDGKQIDVGPGEHLAVLPGENHAVTAKGHRPLVLRYFGVVAS